MGVIVVCGGTLGEVFDILRKDFIDTIKQIQEFNELIKEACMYDIRFFWYAIRLT